MRFEVRVPFRIASRGFGLISDFMEDGGAVRSAGESAGHAVRL